MSYATGTTNYNLPQTVSSDKRDWTDTNQAFADVDAALKGAVDDSATALTNAATAQTTADSAVTAASGAVTTANAASATATTADEKATLATTTANNAATAAATAQTTADGAVTTANAASATASNADTVALAAQTNIGTMSALQTTDKSSLVAAINEVLSQIGGSGMPILDMQTPIHTFTGPETYTVPSDGYLYGTYPSATQSVDVKVNGTTASNTLVLGSTNVYAGFAVPFGVKAGDTIVVTGARATALQTCVLGLYAERQ